MEKPHHNRCWNSEKNVSCEIILKKLAAIFLLSLLLFNMVGYRFVFTMLDNVAAEKQDARIDAGNYDEANLIEVRVPLNMPYQERVTEFERHYGEITVNGIVYTYVKMKVDNNELILKCIPDVNRQQIKNSENSLAKANSSQDMEHNGKKQHNSFSKNVISDYDNKDQTYNLQANKTVVLLSYPEFTTSVVTASIAPPQQPPRC
jgi:hypothetical protein